MALGGYLPKGQCQPQATAGLVGQHRCSVGIGHRARPPGAAGNRSPTRHLRSRLSPVYRKVSCTCLCVDRCKQNCTYELHTRAAKSQTISRLCSNNSFCRARSAQWVSLQPVGALRSLFHQAQKHPHAGLVSHGVRLRPDAPGTRLGHQRRVCCSAL